MNDLGLAALTVAAVIAAVFAATEALAISRPEMTTGNRWLFVLWLMAAVGALRFAWYLGSLPGGDG